MWCIIAAECYPSLWKWFQRTSCCQPTAEGSCCYPASAWNLSWAPDLSIRWLTLVQPPMFGPFPGGGRDKSTQATLLFEWQVCCSILPPPLCPAVEWRWWCKSRGWIFFCWVGTWTRAWTLAFIRVCILWNLLPSHFSSISAQSNFAVGAVVNATFGSIIELTFYITALIKGAREKNKCYEEIVKSALTGTLLSCVLFIPVSLVLTFFSLLAVKTISAGLEFWLQYLIYRPGDAQMLE